MAWNQNNDLVKGDNLLLYLTSGKTVVAYATSVSLSIDGEEIDTSSKFSCKWKAGMGGRMGYTINFDSLYSNNESGVSFDEILAMQIAGNQIDWYIGEEAAFTGSCEDNPHTLDTSAKYYYGKATVQSISLSAGNNEIASCSGTLNGAGEIQIGPSGNNG